jgi:hypothetical protein
MATEYQRGEEMVIHRLERNYLVDKPGTYRILHSEKDFKWRESDIKEFIQLWNFGMPIDVIAKHFGRPVMEVVFLVMECDEKGEISPRPGALFGKYAV